MLITSEQRATLEKVETLQELAGQVVAEAPASERVTVAENAVDQLTPEQRIELAKSLFPQDSDDRRVVYVVGFVVAAVVALGLSAIAWGVASGSDTSGLASAIVVFASAFASAVLGGLLGAYKG